MKIAYIGPTGVFGGVRAIAEHCNGLAARGHEMTLIGTGNEPLTWLPLHANQRPLGDPGGGYDIVVGTAIPTWAATLGLAKACNARPVALLQMAEWLFAPKKSPEYKAMLDAFAAPLDVMAISEWLAQLSEQVPGRKTYRIRNGIDTKLFFPDPFPDLPPKQGQTRVMLEGSFSNPAKDIQAMSARAIRQLRYDEGYPLEVFGLSQFPPEFEFNRFWQNPQQIVIRRIYSSADIFLKASRYEGRPGPDMEAMACGAVVCRAIGAGDDDLKDGENCLKVAYGDYDGFVANFRRLIDDEDLRKRLRENGLEYAKHYTWEGAIDLVEEALTGTVSQPSEARKEYQYDLAEYNDMQRVIVEWETPQAMWLGETLADMLHPKSVIDIGCGPGTYLVPFKPDARVLGVDGAPEAGKALEPYEFVGVDLRNDESFCDITDAAIRHNLVTKGTRGTIETPIWPFDLSLCIEVGEHLPPDRADYLVDLLVTCSDACFFSAAQPGQGGTLHLNEQPKDYWLEKFRARGWDLHKRNDELTKLIAANPHCQRVQWLIGNAMLLGKVKHD